MFINYTIDYILYISHLRDVDVDNDLPVGLSSFVLDRSRLADRLESCAVRPYYDYSCAGAVLKDLALIYETYTSKYTRNSTKLKYHRNIKQLVQGGGNPITLQFEDEDISDQPGKAFFGNFLPLNADMHLVSDWRTGKVDSFITPSFEKFGESFPFGHLRRENTFSLFNRNGINGITRDAEHLIVSMAHTKALLFFSLTDILFNKSIKIPTLEQVKRILRPKCRDQHGNIQNFIFKDIEYEPNSGRLWGLPKNSSLIMEFDVESGNCVGQLDMPLAIQNYIHKAPKFVDMFGKPFPQFDEKAARYRSSKSGVIAGFTFLAKNWLLVSPVDTEFKFIMKIGNN